MLSQRLKKRAVRIAQLKAPVDTGNLQRNAIRGMWWTNKNKFRIKYMASVAPYVEILEDSTWNGKAIERENNHKHFIKETTEAIAVILVQYYSGKKLAPMQRLKKDDLERLERRIKVYQKSTNLFEGLPKDKRKREQYTVTERV